MPPPPAPPPSSTGARPKEGGGGKAQEDADAAGGKHEVTPPATATDSAAGDDATMNHLDRSRLLRCRKQIVEDLEVRVITDYLLENRVLDRQSVQEVEAEVLQTVFWHVLVMSICKFNSIAENVRGQGPKTFGHPPVSGTKGVFTLRRVPERGV